VVPHARISIPVVVLLKISTWSEIVQPGKRAITTAATTFLIMSELTTDLSGPPPAEFRFGEHAIHCEHEAATLPTGPL